MKIFILSCLLPIFAAFAPAVLAQEGNDTPPDVESLMTPEDFKASGLEKLTDAERKRLSEWVERYREGKFSGPQVQKPPSQWTEEEKQAERDFAIVANVIPRFRGWSGKTTFRLDNGQTWQQRMPGRLKYSGASSEVSITKNIMGGYVLEHVDTGRSVLVKRVD